MRLPVILVQNPPAAGAALAEDLVGNLIGRAGLDLTLVDRFESLAADSTDRMTLEAITVPSAILDWRTEEQIFESLKTIGFTGVRCPHQLDPNGASEPGTSNRRLFLFDLSKHKDASKIVAELDRLRDSLSVKTVSLGSLGPISGSINGSKIKHQPVGESQGTKQLAHPTPATTSPPSQAETSTITQLTSPRTDQNLDDLIDQLDDLDV